MKVLNVFPSVSALPDLVVTVYVLPLSTVFDADDPAVLVWVQDPKSMDIAWFIVDERSVNPGSSKTIFLAKVTLEISV